MSDVSHQESEYLKNFLVDEKALKKEYNLRRDKYLYKTIHPKLLDEYIELGWEEHSRLKNESK